MTTPHTDQDDLINFVKDPKNIAKAAEKSMEKRQALIDAHTDQPSPDTHTTSEQIDEFVEGLAYVHLAAVRTVKAEYPSLTNVEQVKRINNLVDRYKTDAKAQLQKLLDEAIKAELEGLKELRNLERDDNDIIWCTSCHMVLEDENWDCGCINVANAAIEAIKHPDKALEGHKEEE